MITKQRQETLKGCELNKGEIKGLSKNARRKLERYGKTLSHKLDALDVIL